MPAGSPRSPVPDSNMGHGHHHPAPVTGRNLVISILLNSVITLAQVIGGLLSGSLSLLSDALHNFSDVLSLVFSLVAHRLSHRPACERRTFGYKRAEIISAFLNAVALIVVALLLGYEAISRFITPVSIAPDAVIWLSLAGIVFNGLSTLLLHKDASQSLNMKSAYLHLFSDTLASVAVLAGGLLMRYFHWFWIDGAITLAISIYLVYLAYDVLRASVGILMQFTPDEIVLSEVTERLQPIIGPHRLYHVHIWRLTDHALHFEARLDCQHDMTVAEFKELASAIETRLHDDFHITHCTLQPDFGVFGPKEIVCQE